MMGHAIFSLRDDGGFCTLLTHLALSSSVFLAINMTVAGCRRRKWLFSAISLLFFLSAVLPLLCVASFVAFVLSLPFGCALVGIWSWHRLHKLAVAIASPVTNGKTEARLIEWGEMKRGDFEDSGDGCCIAGEETVYSVVYGDSEDTRGGVCLWYNPLASNFNAESNNYEMDWSESDAESTVTDQDYAGIKSREGGLLERPDKFEANNEFKAEVSTDAIAFADGVSKPWLLGVDFKEAFTNTQAVLKEAYNTLSCTEESPFSQKRSEFKNLEQMSEKCAVPDSPMGEAYENLVDVGQNSKCAEEHQRRVRKGKRKAKLCAQTVSRIPPPGNDCKKKSKSRRIRVSRGGVKELVSANCGGPLMMRGRCSAEAGQSESGQTMMSGVKRSSAEAAIASTVSSDDRERRQGNKDGSRRVMSSGVDSVHKKGTRQHLVDSSLAPELEDARRTPPSTGLDLGIMCASDKTYPKFHQLLEFWRRTEQAAPSTTYLSPH